jgi:hypothetical protein
MWRSKWRSDFASSSFPFLLILWLKLAIDVWAAGMILLFFLVRKFPLFQSSDDIEALMELAAILGRKKMEKAATLHSESLSYQPDIWVVENSIRTQAGHLRPTFLPLHRMEYYGGNLLKSKMQI